MKKLFSFLITVVICIFMISCSEAGENTEHVVWNDIDLTYWWENDMIDGGFTVALMTDNRTASGKEMNKEVLHLLADTQVTAIQQEDYFAYIKDKTYHAIHFLRDDEDGGSMYLIFTEDFSVMAVFENLAENKQDGTLIYPQPDVYSVTDGSNIRTLFEKYDFRF